MTLDEQIEILQAAKEGKEIEFLYMKPDTWHTMNTQLTPNFNFINGTYRIKKKTKKVYLFVVKGSHRRISTTVHYYENEKEVLSYLPNCTIIKRLDYTEIEIDE